MASTSGGMCPRRIKKKKGPPLYKDFLHAELLDVCDKEKHQLREATDCKIGDIVICSNRGDFRNPTDIGKVMYVAPAGVMKCLLVSFDLPSM